ncbi:molybdopterin dehydrogenase FAD binding domain-containing protein [[Clostridium] lactatifermentans DSM 14214]|uniref:Molybdopterin dehydrogenase FAD binding domain-containing protein n=2 Tax=Anaerotignum lactatifermentans TaxID=160404 RepID=A0A1M6NQS9_9FIRM|nr:molybdopterin dehydrogenase FAD binding domain-containing protein [[Clostridium] lactatifermentans DSM 14214] [Anaerotignum lactatifermentans DSM 14214]
MRNCATVGGSIYGRFGFSDILCCLLGLDCDVELYKQGRMPLADFAKMKKDNDILVRVIIKKTPLETVYLSQRNTETDFPVVSCAVTKDAEGYYAVIGARPCQPVVVRDSEGILAKAEVTAEDLAAFASKVQNGMDFADNTRCSGAYRRHVAGVLVKRGLKQLMGGDK